MPLPLLVELVPGWCSGWLVSCLFCIDLMGSASNAVRKAGRSSSGSWWATVARRYSGRSSGSFSPGTSTKQRTCTNNPGQGGEGNGQSA
jgi:hypothetical protein